MDDSTFLAKGKAPRARRKKLNKELRATASTGAKARGRIVLVATLGTICLRALIHQRGASSTAAAARTGCWLEEVGNYDCEDMKAVERVRQVAFKLSRRACNVSQFDSHFLGGACSMQLGDRTQACEAAVAGGQLNLAHAFLQGRTLLFLGDSVSQQHWLQTIWLLSQLSSGLMCPEYTALAYRDFSFDHERARCASTAGWQRPADDQHRRRHGFRVCFGFAGTENTLLARFQSFLSSLSLDAEDVVVLNAGIWFADNVAGLQQLVAEFVEFVDSSSEQLPILLWRETSPQHFPHRRPSSVTSDNFWQYGPGSYCEAASANNSTLRGGRMAHVNRATNAIVASSQKVHLVRIWEASIDDWSSHLGSTVNRRSNQVTDCTHYCLLPSPTISKWTVSALDVALALVKKNQ